MDFAGKAVVLTGASSGIGQALAKELAARGARVGAIARRSDKLAALTGEVRSKGGTIETATADVGDRPALHAAIRELEVKHGPTDLLIANAGVASYSGADPLDAIGDETMMRVNFLGVVYAFEAVLPAMIARGSGHLAAVSSLAAFKGLPGSAGYCASKAAVTAYCEAFRIELAPRGIAVTTIHPGFVRSEMTAKNKHRMPFMWEADVAAKRITDALARRRKVYSFPWIMVRLMRAARFAPDRMIRKRVQAGPPKPV